VDADLSAQDVGSDRMNLYLNITPPGDWSYRIQSFTYFDKTFRNAAGNATAEFDGYTTVDALVAWAVHPSTRLTLGVTNVLDEQYLTYYSQAGNTRNDRFNAGRGRTFIVRANFRF
jgi:iron complex outermembrane receptor protein